MESSLLRTKYVLNLRDNLVLLVSLIVSLVSCTSAPPPSALPRCNDLNKVTIISRPGSTEKTRYERGESVLYAFKIENNDNEPLEIMNLALERYRFAFGDPTKFHLTSPSGVDLLSPYRVEKEKSYNPTFLSVSPGEDALWYIELTDWAYLRESGEYVFEATFLDKRGCLRATNTVTFEVLNTPAYEQPEHIGLTLTYQEGDPSQFIATYTNYTNAPLVILKPQVGSFGGWVNPIYRLIIEDEQGRILPPYPEEMRPEDVPVYDASHMLSLGAGETYNLQFPLFYYPGLDENSGMYHARLVYIVRENAMQVGQVLDDPMNWEDNVFVGILESNVVTFEIE